MKDKTYAVLIPNPYHPHPKFPGDAEEVPNDLARTLPRGACEEQNVITQVRMTTSRGKCLRRSGIMGLRMWNGKYIIALFKRELPYF